MKQFKDLGVKQNPTKGFVGDKVDIDRIINVPIVVVDYKIEPSNFKEKGDGMRLTLQFELNGTKHILFTGSAVLKDSIQQVDKGDFPFAATIVKVNKHFEFQ